MSQQEKVWKIRVDEFPSAGTAEQQILFVLRYAILAPSTHNSQPWLFKIEGNRCVFLYNPKLRLPQADPTGRDLFMSLGACLENFIIAAKYVGIYESHTINIIDTQVAEVKCKQAGEKDKLQKKLLHAILARRTVRGPIPSLNGDPSIWAEIAATIEAEYGRDGITTKVLLDRNQIDGLAKIQEEAILMAYKRKEFRKEFSHWVVSNISTRNEGIPGYAITLPLLPSLIFPLMVRLFDVGLKLSKINYTSVAMAPVVCMLMSNQDNPTGWVQAGRASERWMLECVVAGSAVSIYVASIEMGELYKKVQALLGLTARPQFVFLTGYIAQPDRKPTARHALERCIIKSIFL